MQTLRKTLENIHDSEWLDKNSPLAAVLFAGVSTENARRRQIILTGLNEVDTTLRAIWHQWEEQEKTPLQTLLWEAVCHLPPDLDNHSQAVLLLTYFQNPRPKQITVVNLLAIGRSTYYRYLDQAVESLGLSLVQTLRPALRLEKPVPRPLIGRTELLAQAGALLKTGKVVHVVGGGGMGKSSLGAQLAAGWPGSVFWYTFRRGVSDTLEQLLYSLAYFFHEQGASSLWLYLNTQPDELHPPGGLQRGVGSSAMAVLRGHLRDLQGNPPLFCFDEIDLLLAGDLHDSPEHAQIRAFLDDLLRAAQPGIPTLLIGQKLLFEPEPECLLTLSPWTGSELTQALHRANISLDEEARTRLLEFTRGNPLLLQLFLVLHRHNLSLDETLQRLNAPVTLEWFLLRLRQHLEPADLVVLEELSIFRDGAPRRAWRSRRRRLNSLLEVGLIQELGAERVDLHPALRELIYMQIPTARKLELHEGAGHLLAELGRFTAAAGHYLAAEQPELAVWTWYTHREQELQQGQGRAALQLFAPLAGTKLQTTQDDRALALLLGPLWARMGQAAEGLAQLERTSWPDGSLSAAHGHELRGQLLGEIGNVESALAEYRRSLESVATLRATQEAELHIRMGRRALEYLGDQQQARHSARQARLDLELLQGEIEDVSGNHVAAREHYTCALALAEGVANHHLLAKIHESLGILEGRYGELSTALAYMQDAGEHYAAAGNEVCAVGMNDSGPAWLYFSHRRWEEVIEPAERALLYYNEIGHAYWQAINEHYLAESWYYLGNLTEAERYARLALEREEVIVRSYCLCVLGQVRRVQAQFEEAERFLRDALSASEQLQDPWGLAPAWRALGELFRDVERHDEARGAFDQALALFLQLEMAEEVRITQEMLDALPVRETA